MDKQEVAIAAVWMIRHMINEDHYLIDYLLAVPNLFSPLAILCGYGDGVLLRSSNKLVMDIAMIACDLSQDRASALVEAGWADPLVKALRTKSEDMHIIGAIYLMFYNRDRPRNDAIAAFIAAGAESALEEAIIRNLTNRIVTEWINKMLIVLRM